MLHERALARTGYACDHGQPANGDGHIYVLQVVLTRPLDRQEPLRQRAKFRDHDPIAQATGLSASHFSFNRPEGACPTCKGMGAVEVKMQYLYSVWIRCADCEGQRFSEEVLAARIPFGDEELSIADFYELSVGEAMPLLLEAECLLESGRQAARRILTALHDVGLGYLPLGQPSPTLSGGEAQRVKLAKHLGQRSLATRLLVLDEPSTGLHPQDIAGLLIVLNG